MRRHTTIMVEHPTSSLGSLAHLLKSSLGSGILAMPAAFKNAGQATGAIGTMVVGFICTRCYYVLNSNMAERDDYVVVMKALGDRVVNKSKRPGDRYHIGKLLIERLKSCGNELSQIDGGTGEQETAISSLQRSIRCAEVFRNLKLKVGDFIIVSSPSTLDLVLPLYAAMYLGITVLIENYNQSENSLKVMDFDFTKYKPKLVICQSDMVKTIKEVAEQTNLDADVISFSPSPDAKNLKDLMQRYGNVSVDNFIAADFDPSTTISFIAKSSGTTGAPKAAALSHKNLVLGGSTLMGWCDFSKNHGTFFILASLSWVSSLGYYIGAPLMGYPRLQTSKTMTLEHFCELVNTYRPSYACISPPFFSAILKMAQMGKLDLSCFETITCGGCPVPPTLVKLIKQLVPNLQLVVGYGLTELSGVILTACGAVEMVPVKNIQFEHKLVHPETGKTITEPNVAGELWLKSDDHIFLGYYKDPEMTKQVMTDDGWFKTGDMLKINEDGTYSFVERVKLILKYYYPEVLERYYIIVTQVEDVIRTHPGVQDVAVTGIPDPACGDLVVACVVLKDGVNVTAQEIKDLVQNQMADHNQLRGGVIFVQNLPYLPSLKVDRVKLKELAINSERQ